MAAHSALWTGYNMKMTGSCELREAVLQGRIILPIRHMQIMRVVARCRFCEKFFCCAKHRRVHEEIDHSPGSGGKALVQCKPKNYQKVADLTESSLALSVRDGDFPIQCLYCEMEFISKSELEKLFQHNKLCLPQIPDRCHLLARKQQELNPTPTPSSGILKDVSNIYLNRKLSVVFGMDNNSAGFKTPLPLGRTLLHVAKNDRVLSSRSIGSTGGISTSTPFPYQLKNSFLFVKGSLVTQDVTSPLATVLVSPVDAMDVSDPIFDTPCATSQAEIVELIQNVNNEGVLPTGGKVKRKVTFAGGTSGNSSGDINELPVSVGEQLEYASDSDMSVESLSDQYNSASVLDYSGDDASKSFQIMASEDENSCDTIATSCMNYEEEIQEGTSQFTKIVNAISSAWQSACSGIKSTSEKWMKARRVRSPSSSPQEVFQFGEPGLSNKRLKLSTPSPNKLLYYLGHKTTYERRYTSGPLRYISARPPISRMRQKR